MTQKRPNMEVWAKTLGNFILSKNIFKDTYKPNQPASPKPRKTKRSSYKTTTKSAPKRGIYLGLERENQPLQPLLPHQKLSLHYLKNTNDSIG